LIEAIIPEGSDPNWVTTMDLQMLTLLTGRERTEREYKALLAAVGFRLDRSIDIGLKTSILEATTL
jgi:O-methyltransferase domain